MSGAVQPAGRRAPRFGGAARPAAGRLARGAGTGAAHADRGSAALPAGHPALVEGRTLFPSRVVAPEAAPRVLVSGFNAAKIGARIAKGPWRGLPVVTLTLEERATCPASCGLWAECYDNAMPLARRHRHGPGLIAALDRELRALAAAHPGGFAVRLHVLGDFWSMDYLAAWVRWMAALPGLHVWGYTAHGRQTPIGGIVAEANEFWPGRWAVRFSVPPGGPAGPMQATTIWRRPATAVVPEGIVCPAQTGATDACATCGLCWAPAAAGRRIVFIGHGRRGRGASRDGAGAGDGVEIREEAMADIDGAMRGTAAVADGGDADLLAGVAALVERRVAAALARERELVEAAGFERGWRAAMNRVASVLGEKPPFAAEWGKDDGPAAAPAAKPAPAGAAPASRAVHPLDRAGAAELGAGPEEHAAVAPDMPARQGAWITEARLEVLRALVPTETRWREIWERLLAASPEAPPPVSIDAVKTYAKQKLGLARPDSPLGQHLRRVAGKALAVRRGAPLAAEAAVESAAAADAEAPDVAPQDPVGAELPSVGDDDLEEALETAHAPPADPWSPERDRLLRERWPTPDWPVQVVDDINALPGPVVDWMMVRDRAERHLRLGPRGAAGESPQLVRARELLAMGLHVHDIVSSVRLSAAELATLKAAAARVAA